MGFLSGLLSAAGGIGGFLLGGPAGAAAGATIGASLSGAQAASDAAQTQADAGRAAIGSQEGMFNRTQANIAPFVSAGQQYAGTLSDIGKTGYATHQFGPEDLKNGLAPNYDFVRQQGLMAANNAASVQGGLGGTNAQRSAIDYAEGLAGNAYQQAFTNYNAQRNQIFGNLNSIASLGSNAAVGQGNISANVGANIGNTITGIGNAQAAGQVGSVNAITSGIGNAIGGYGYLTNLGKIGANPTGNGTAFTGWNPIGSSESPSWGNNPSAYVGP